MDQGNEAFAEDLNPRRLPKPAQFSQVPVKASVPDVSLIINHKSADKQELGHQVSLSPSSRDCRSVANNSRPSPLQSYNSWKARQSTHKPTDLSDRLTDDLPRVLGPRPYNGYASKSDLVHPVHLPPKTHSQFDNDRQSFIRDNIISPENVALTTKYAKRNPLSELQSTVEEAGVRRSFESNKFTWVEDEQRKTVRDASDCLVYTSGTIVIPKDSKQITRSPLHKENRNKSAKNKSGLNELQHSVTVSSPRGSVMTESYRNRSGVMSKHSFSQTGEDDCCCNGNNRHHCSGKGHSSSTCSVNDLIQAQNNVFEKTSRVLDQMCTVNQKQCQMLEEILQKMSNLEMQHDSILVQLLQLPAHNKDKRVIVETSSSSRVDKVCPPCRPLSTDGATQTCSGDYRTFAKHTVGVMTDPMQLDSESLQSQDKELEFQKGYPVDPVTQRNSVVENDGNGGVVSTDLAAAIKDCQQMRSVLKRHHPESSVGRPVDESLTLHGVDVLTVAEEPPSPLPSLHLDIQDYQESSDEEGDDELESEHQNENFPVGNSDDNDKDNMSSWTFYNNVVGQVNKFLQSPATASQQTNDVPAREEVHTGRKTPSVEAIRIATIEQIRKLGVSVYEESTEIKEVSTTRRVKFDSVMWPGDRELTSESSDLDSSMQINALALKYLKDDQLSELTKMSSGKKSFKVYNMGQKSTNMSLATQHYLERYKLLPQKMHPTDEVTSPTNPDWERNYLRREKLPTEGGGIHRMGKKCAQLPPHRSSLIHQTDKILDITTLKQQPKLL